MKKICLGLLIFILLPVDVLANESTDLKISTRSASVGNMNYRIIKKGSVYQAPLDILISSPALKENIEVKINDGYLFLEDLPFGEYQIKVCDDKTCDSFQRSINTASILNQHKTEDLIASEHSVQIPATGATKEIALLSSCLGISLLSIIIWRAYEKIG